MKRAADDLALSREQWSSRLYLLAADALLSQPGQDCLTLDKNGRTALARALESSRERGTPVRFVFLDSASTLSSGAGVDENDNTAVTAWLRDLQSLAVRFSVYVFVIHHKGHSKRSGAVHQSRGASAFNAVARVIWTLDRPRNAYHERRLTVVGNSIPEVTHRFTVADAASPAAIFGFEPIASPLTIEEKINRVTTIGEPVSVADVAREILDLEGAPAPSQARAINGALRKRVQRALDRGSELGTVERDTESGRYKRLAQLHAAPNGEPEHATFAAA